MSETTTTQEALGVVGSGPWAEMIVRVIAGSQRVVVWPGLNPDGLATWGVDRDQFKVVDTPEAFTAAARLVILAVEMAELRPTLAALGGALAGYHRVVHTLRHLEPHTGLQASVIIRALTPVRQIGALAGPIRPELILSGKPGGAIVGSRFPQIIAQIQQFMARSTLRVYGNKDIDGVEIAAATAMAPAVAVGMGDAMGLGSSVRGMLFARGVAEMVRLGGMTRAEAATFSGMAGLGYLISTTTEPGGAAYRIGRALASGVALDAVRADHPTLDELAEGCVTIQARAEQAGVEAHITAAIGRVLSGDISVGEAAQALLTLGQMME